MASILNKLPVEGWLGMEGGAAVAGSESGGVNSIGTGADGEEIGTEEEDEDEVAGAAAIGNGPAP